jgi:hypothetical protein
MLKGNYGNICEGGNIVNVVQEPEKREKKGVYTCRNMLKGTRGTYNMINHISIGIGIWLVCRKDEKL